MLNTNYALSGYTFELPEDLIAQVPSSQRDASRLLVYSKEKKEIEHTQFKNILNFLPQGKSNKKPLFIANNSKVVPARLFGESPHKGKRELLLLTPPPLIEKEKEKSTFSEKEYMAYAEVLLKPSRMAKVQSIWEFGGLKVEILEKYDFGKHKVRLHWNSEDTKDSDKKSLTEFFEKNGSLPLPPYIKREENTLEDKERYQTIYANEEKAGSVAAPTAGLHFTNELKESLLNEGCEWYEVTLHVGYGTFTPVRTEDIREHLMHSEFFELSKETAKAILKAKEENRPIIAVGTTSCRVLEGASVLWNKKDGNILPCDGMVGATNIFIYPEGKNSFQVIDALITNFHLPQSSLLMLVSAFAGREEILKVYKEAVAKNYRFFSYGDAMLIKSS